MRLQKYLAHAGVCSRRKAEQYIKEGKVTVNGLTVSELGTQIDPESDLVTFMGEPVILNLEQEHVYIALNKPKGYVSSCFHKNAKTVLDLVKAKKRIYPVGRLDKDSEGLLLLTDDGELHNRLSHPSFDHEKEYIVQTQFPLKNSELVSMAKGIVIEGEKTRRAKVKRISKNRFRIILKQGRNRQIRKMVSSFKNQVTSLTRVRMANITLDDIKPGKWRYLTSKEIEKLTQ